MIKYVGKGKEELEKNTLFNPILGNPLSRIVALYHRLNVGRGPEDISLEEWGKLGGVWTHTETYLKTIDESLDMIVDALLGIADVPN